VPPPPVGVSRVGACLQPAGSGRSRWLQTPANRGASAFHGPETGHRGQPQIQLQPQLRSRLQPSNRAPESAAQALRELSLPAEDSGAARPTWIPTAIQLLDENRTVVSAPCRCLSPAQTPGPEIDGLGGGVLGPSGQRHRVNTQSARKHWAGTAQRQASPFGCWSALPGMGALYISFRYSRLIRLSALLCSPRGADSPPVVPACGTGSVACRFDMLFAVAPATVPATLRQRQFNTHTGWLSTGIRERSRDPGGALSRGPGG